MAFIFATMLIDILGLGIIIPVLPKLVGDVAGGSALLFGVLSSCYGLMQFLFLPVLGALSDTYGRRPVLLVSMLFTGLEYVIMALANSFGVLLAGRLLSGITGASLTVAQAYIVDVTPPEKRAQGFGLVGAAFALGFILGPALGGVLGMWSPRAPFWASAILSFVNFLYGALVLPESLPPENRRAFQRKSILPAAGFAVLARIGWVRALLVALVFLSLAQQALQNTWVLYTTYRFGWNELDNGLSLAMVGLCSAVVQTRVTGRLVRRFGEPKSVLIGLAFNFAGFLLFGLGTRSWMMAVAIAVFGIGGVVGPTIQSLITREYGPDEQGLLQGSMTSVHSLCAIAGPLLATGIFGYFTSAEAPWIVPGAPFFFAALLSLLANIFTLRALKLRAG
jgi:MFS transporter, DHA1 family, tetracycline resistance protein